MTFKLSNKSLKLLENAHPDLLKVVVKAMSYQVMDFTVNEVARTAARQKQLFDQGATKTLNSRHLIQPDGYSHAVDLYPYPIDMVAINDRNNKNHAKEIFRFGVLSGIMKTAACEVQVDITNGADWDNDGETLDHSFFDAPHFELRR